MKRIIISRTDNLGDVILTLPMAGILKQEMPGCYIIFLGKAYTRPLIEACKFIDQFLDVETLSSIQHSCLSGRQAASSISSFIGLKADIILHVFPVKEIQKLAKTVKIPLRIGTSHRWYSWLYCNKLIHYSRKKSNLHEAQLNLKLLEPLGIRKEFPLSEIPSFYGLTKLTTAPWSPRHLGSGSGVSVQPHTSPEIQITRQCPGMGIGQFLKTNQSSPGR